MRDRESYRTFGKPDVTEGGSTSQPLRFRTAEYRRKYASSSGEISCQNVRVEAVQSWKLQTRLSLDRHAFRLPLAGLARRMAEILLTLGARLV